MTMMINLPVKEVTSFFARVLHCPAADTKFVAKCHLTDGRSFSEGVTVRIPDVERARWNEHFEGLIEPPIKGPYSLHECDGDQNLILVRQFHTFLRAGMEEGVYYAASVKTANNRVAIIHARKDGSSLLPGIFDKPLPEGARVVFVSS